MGAVHSRASTSIRAVAFGRAQSVSRQAKAAVFANSSGTMATRTIQEVAGDRGGRGQEEDFWHRSSVGSVGFSGHHRRTRGPVAPGVVEEDQTSSAGESHRRTSRRIGVARGQSEEAIGSPRRNEGGVGRRARSRSGPACTFEGDGRETHCSRSIIRAKLAAVEEERDAALQARPAKKLATARPPLRTIPVCRRILCRCATKTSCGGCKIAKRTFGTRPWPAMHTKWRDCARSWDPQPWTGQQSQ